MSNELITFEQPSSPIAETFRGLRTNLQFSTNKNNEELKTILVTSFDSGEGKSWVAANLAVSYAQKNDNVIIIDTDMRRGRQHNVFETSLKPGLSDMLNLKKKDGKNIQLIDYVKGTMMPNLKVIPAGVCPRNPTELLLNERMEHLIDETSEVADRVIVDAPPVTMIADTILLARKVDGIILVLEQGRRKVDDLKKMIKDLKKAGGNIVGIVFNKVPHNRKSYTTGSYYYGNVPDEINNRGRK